MPDTAALPVWSRRLREHRTARGLSQQELADKCAPPLALGTISAIERGGHAGTDSLLKLAEALEIPLGALFLDDAQGELTPGQTSELITALIECVTKTFDDFRKRR